MEGSIKVTSTCVIFFVPFLRKPQPVYCYLLQTKTFHGELLHNLAMTIISIFTWFLPANTFRLLYFFLFFYS